MTIVEDREVLREVWGGRIPTIFTLSDVDQGTNPPPPCCLMLPRMSYLPLATEKVRKHFIHHMTETEPGDMWFSYNDIPLRWHHPIGLLHDLLVRERDLPWPLTVHFSQFPTEQILPCSTRDQVLSTMGGISLVIIT